jgi:NAD(P)-dependent dehydrogenase (short-subunit alcohol dehydrogenase family)
MLSPTPEPIPQTSRLGGTLIFTGATSATRGAANFATFAAGKHGVRALSQSLAKEFGKRDIHIAHVIIDGPILTHRIKQMFGGKQKMAQTVGAELDTDVNWLEDESKRLDPTSIAKVQYILRHFY